MIVVDTQLIVYRILPGPSTSLAERVSELDANWVAPPLWQSEFLNVLAGYMRRGELGAEEAFLGFQRAAAAVRNGTQPSAQLILALVSTSPCTAYDLEFVALAEQVNVPLVTNDRQILAAFPGRAVTPAAFVA